MFIYTASKRVIHILLAVSLFVTTLLITKPASADGLPSNPAAEAYLLSELRASGYADLSGFTQEERVIGGDFLLSTLKDPDVQKQPLIYIANATIAGDLFANDLAIPANIFFSSMEFEGLVTFDSAQLQDVIINNSKFLDSLSFLRATLNGNVDLRDNTINESLNFYGAHISGELLLDGSQILGTEAMSGTSFPTEFWTTTVDGVASFYGVNFKGDAYFAQSNFKRLDLTGVTFGGSAGFSETIVEHSANFSNAQFSSEADFTNFQTGGDLNFNGATFNATAIFENAATARDANFVGVTFNGQATFDYFSAARFVDFTNATFKQAFSFYYTTVAYPYFDNTVFDGTVTFEGMQTSQDFELVNTSYNYTKEPFPVNLARVAGAVRFTGFTAPAGLLLSNSHFGSLSIITKDNPEIASIDLTATDIDGDLLIEKVNTKSFSAEGLTVGKSTTLHHMSISEKLDMSNASVAFSK